MAAHETVKQEVDLNDLEPILAGFKEEKWALIPLRQRVQEKYGYIPPDAIEPIARSLRLFPSEVQGVVTFYSQFYLTRRGRNIVRQCDGTACHVKGAGAIVERMQQELGIHAGQTTPDYRVTCEVVYCVGSCGLAPVAVVNEQTIGKMAPERMAAILRGLG